MKDFIPRWFFQVFVMPFLFLIMTIAESLAWKDRGFGLTEFEENQIYNKVIVICLTLGVLSCAFVFYSLTNLFTK